MAVATVLLSSCSAPVSADFRIRFWEKFIMLGQRAMGVADFKTAERMFAAAVDQSRHLPAAGDTRLIVALTDRGWASLCVSDIAQASKSFSEALRLCESAERDRDASLLAGLKARCLTGLADCLRAQKKYAEAAELYSSALKAFASAGEGPHVYDIDGRIANAANEGLAASLLAQGKVSDALSAMSNATRWDWSVDPLGKSYSTLDKRTRLQWLAGRNEQALDNTPELWVGSIRDGRDALRQSDSVSAEAFFKDAMQFADAVGSDAGHSLAAHYLMQLYRRTGRLAEASACGETAMRMRSSGAESPVDALQATLKQDLGEIYMQAGKPGEAAKLFQEALQIREGLGTLSPGVIAQNLAEYSLALSLTGRKQQAEQNAEEAKTWLRKTVDRGELCQAALALSRFYMHDGHVDLAKSLAQNVLKALSNAQYGADLVQEADSIIAQAKSHSAPPAKN